MRRHEIGKLVYPAVIVALTTLLAACGGGGGGEESASTPVAGAPTIPVGVEPDPGAPADPTEPVGEPTSPPTEPTTEPTIDPNPGSVGQYSVSVEWNAPLTRTDGSALTSLGGYRIYYGAAPDQLTQIIDVTNPGVLTYVVTGLFQGTYYFAVTALDSDRIESAPSNVMERTIS